MPHFNFIQRIPFEKGRELAERYQVEPYLRPLMEYDPHAAARSGGVDRTPTKEQAMAAQRKQQQQHPPGTGILLIHGHTLAPY